MARNNDSITLSEKHGVNPSVLCCATCGKDIGVVLMGKLKDDAAAPRSVIDGSMCDECLSLKERGILVVEATMSEQTNKRGQPIPIPTGRIVVLREQVLDDPENFNEEMREHLRKTRVLFMTPTEFTRNFDQAFIPGQDGQHVINNDDGTKN